MKTKKAIWLVVSIFIILIYILYTVYMSHYMVSTMFSGDQGLRGGGQEAGVHGNQDIINPPQAQGTGVYGIGTSDVPRCLDQNDSPFHTLGDTGWMSLCSEYYNDPPREEIKSINEGIRDYKGVLVGIEMWYNTEDYYALAPNLAESLALTQIIPQAKMLGMEIDGTGDLLFLYDTKEKYLIVLHIFPMQRTIIGYHMMFATPQNLKEFINDLKGGNSVI